MEADVSWHPWVEIVAVIELFFAAAIISAVVTKRTAAIFAAGFNVMIPVIALYLWQAPSLHTRALLGAVMAVIYLLRLNWVILVWTRNTAMSKLDDALPPLGKIGLAFVLAHCVGLGYCLPFYFIGLDATPLGWKDALALGVYVVGTVFHAGADYQKVRFKRRTEMQGQVLSTGWWSVCRHPNYFGDFLIYVSFALLAQHPYAWLSPLLNLSQYLFDAIPKNEKWASEKYGVRWQAYKNNTSMFLPGLPRNRRG